MPVAPPHKIKLAIKVYDVVIEKQLRNNFLAKNMILFNITQVLGTRKSELIPTQPEDPNMMEFLKTITQSILKLITNIPLR